MKMQKSFHWEPNELTFWEPYPEYFNNETNTEIGNAYKEG